MAEVVWIDARAFRTTLEDRLFDNAGDDRSEEVARVLQDIIDGLNDVILKASARSEESKP